MSDESPDDHEEHQAGAWAVSNFFTPPVCAIAALTLAIVALLDQNTVTVGFAAVLEEQVSGTGFFVSGAWRSWCKLPSCFCWPGGASAQRAAW